VNRQIDNAGGKGDRQSFHSLHHDVHDAYARRPFSGCGAGA
jgi:hypothetical protein